ncbi:MAG: transmembrane anchor protein [Lautropia sp.]
MYNTSMPDVAELPSHAQLLKSTAIAAVSAMVILTTIILPAEYGVDPTGIGKVLRLTEMGEIKTQLAAEAAADAAASVASPRPGQSPTVVEAVPVPPVAPRAVAPSPPPAPTSPPASTLSTLPAPTVQSPLSQPVAPPAESASPSRATAWRDEHRFTLVPGQGIEVKLRMKGGSRAEFDWVAQGGVVNYDTHGDGGGQSVSYETGRGVPSKSGTLVAAFTGNHGWFWRNRTRANVDVVLRTRGDYVEMVLPK